MKISFAIPLRLQLNLLCLAGLLAVGFSSALIFTRAWSDLARGYGLLKLSQKIATLQAGQPLPFEKGEWALQWQNGTEKNFNWLQAPLESDGLQKTQIASQLIRSVQESRVSEGQFELNPAHQKESYFVAFHIDEKGGTAMGTRSHLSLKSLSPWAAPFLGSLLLSVLVVVAAMSFLTTRVSLAYAQVSAALRNIGAGRMENLKLSGVRDHSIIEMNAALSNMADILQKKEKKLSEVSKLADEDPMTGLPNYRAFCNYSEGLLSKAKLGEKQFPVVAIVDLDFFKKVNDNYGHQAGDFVLRTVSKIIQDNLRLQSEARRTAKENYNEASSDFGARYGGEEFVLIYSGCTEENYFKGALRLTHAIRNAEVLIPAEINEKKVPVHLPISASVGIAAWDATRFKSREEWLGEADAALYEAKKRGRARLIVLHPVLREWT